MTFVNALVFSGHKRLLTKEQIVSVATCADEDAALRLLAEYGWTSEIAAPDNALRRKEESLVAWVKEYAPASWVRSYCLLPYDMRNAEWAVRSRYLGIAPKYGVEGDVAIAEMEKAAAGEKADIPLSIAQAIEKARALYESGEATGSAVYTVCANVLYTTLRRTVKGVCKQAVTLEIDGKNMAVALRSHTPTEAEAQWLDNGDLSKADLSVVAGGDREAAARRLKYTLYADWLRLAWQDMDEGRPTVLLEQAVNSEIVKRLKEKRYETEGLTPWLLYWHYCQSELANVRLALAAAAVGADKAEVEKRLRVGYGG